MLTDAICALATVPGRSAVALIRVAGRGSFEILRRLLGLADGDSLPPARSATLATFRDPGGEPLDRGLVTIFPSPRSYTGDDAFEITCHGGALVPAQLLAALQAFGARPAHRGEFTRRALENGKLDLLQAEAVGDLVDAVAPAQGRAALRQLDGNLSHRVLGLRADLVDTLALLAYDIDFPEEDDGPLDRARLAASLERVRAAVGGLVDNAPLGERLRAGALVVLAGRPNAGKSSLFNALLGHDRALVTDVPGTTRDTIEAFTDIDGWPLRLADTAGLHESADRVERLGIEVSRRYLGAADLVLLCVEGARPLDPSEQAIADGQPTLVVHTKSDVASPTRGVPYGLSVSAVTGSGLAELRATLADRLFGSLALQSDLEPLLTRARHRAALEQAKSALDDGAVELASSSGDAVLVAHHVRRAVTSLDELVGAVGVDEVLGRVFENFCVGK